jgi:hypothetical protein
MNAAGTEKYASGRLSYEPANLAPPKLRSRTVDSGVSEDDPLISKIIRDLKIQGKFWLGNNGTRMRVFLLEGFLVHILPA